MPLTFIIVITLMFFGAVLSSPQSVTLDGKKYFVLLTQTNKKSLRISGLNIGQPIVYLVLKNWHKKQSGIGLTTQNNFFN